MLPGNFLCDRNLVSFGNVLLRFCHKKVYQIDNVLLDWLALHLRFGSVYILQLGGISRHHVDQLQI